MTRPTFADISLSALQHNLQRVHFYAPGSHVISMVKANAYGHGVESCVAALRMSERFGVCSLEEALTIRNVVPNDVVLMEGFFDVRELPIIAAEDFIVVVHTHWQLDQLEQYKGAHAFRVCLKINTGMNRLGVPLSDVGLMLNRLTHCDSVKKPITVMTHLANADDVQDKTSLIQFEKFHQAVANTHLSESVANSAAILAWPKVHADWVRPGLMLYGISPFAEKTAADFGLKPVMTLRSEIIALQQCDKGDRIGYGGIDQCDKPTLVGVIAIGYGDGYPRHTPSGTSVLVAGQAAPLIGRVSMDMITVDCSALVDVKIGSPVVLWGEGLPIEYVAKQAGTIPYELTCRLTPRVPRRYHATKS